VDVLGNRQGLCLEVRKAVVSKRGDNGGGQSGTVRLGDRTEANCYRGDSKEGEGPGRVGEGRRRAEGVGGRSEKVRWRTG
jgi:hypothetical protein